MNDERALRRGTFLGLAAGAALGTAFAVPDLAAADDLRTLRILAVPTDGVKSTLYAQRANLFREHGLQADVTPLGSGAAIFAALVGDAADIGSGSLFPVFAAYSRGIPLRIVAPASLYTSDRADALLVVLKDSQIQSGHDMNGKTIAADSIKDVYATATRAWVDQHGGDGSSLRAVELKPTEQVNALEAGRIDAVVLKSPYLQTALAGGKVRVLAKPLDAIAPRFLLSCWVATADFVAKNPAVVSGYDAAMAEAARYTNAHQSATTEMVAAFTGQDAAVLEHGIRSVTAETLLLSDIQPALDFAVKYGIIEKGFDVSGLLATPQRGR